MQFANASTEFTIRSGKPRGLSAKKVPNWRATRGGGVPVLRLEHRTAAPSCRSAADDSCNSMFWRKCPIALFCGAFMPTRHISLQNVGGFRCSQRRARHAERGQGPVRQRNLRFEIISSLFRLKFRRYVPEKNNLSGTTFQGSSRSPPTST